MGGALGSLVGGAMTQLTAQTWRSPFYLMTGVSGACFFAGLLWIEKDTASTEADRRVDWLGAFLVTAGLTLIVFVLSDGSIAPNGWRTGYIIALIVIGVLLIALFLLWQHYLERVREDPTQAKSRWTPPPLMSLSIWTRAKGRMAVMLTIAFLEWCSFLSWTFWAQVWITHGR